MTGSEFTAAPGTAPGGTSAPPCAVCRRPADGRLVYAGRNVLGNVETIAHGVCDAHADAYAADVIELGWTVIGMTDADDGPIGSSLDRGRA